jgi:hypothetical protein
MENKQVERTLRNILNTWKQGLLSQEETINLIKEAAGYEQVSISGRGSHQDRTDLQGVQSPDKNGEG